MDNESLKKKLEACLPPGYVLRAVKIDARTIGEPGKGVTFVAVPKKHRRTKIRTKKNSHGRTIPDMRQLSGLRALEWCPLGRWAKIVY